MAIQTLGRVPTFPTGPGRTYSVWDWSRLDYEYYVDPSGNPDPGGWNFRPGPVGTAPISGIGDPIENLLRELPPSAIYIGRGPDAKGEVAVKNRQTALWGQTNVPGGAGMGAVGAVDQVPTNLMKWVLIGGVAFLLLGGYAKLKQAF